MEHRNHLALEVTKHIITISMAAIGLLVSGIATVFKDTHELTDFTLALLSFALAIVFAVLSQMALVSHAQGDKKAFGIIKDEYIINTSWAMFLLGIGICVMEFMDFNQ